MSCEKCLRKIFKILVSTDFEFREIDGSNNKHSTGENLVRLTPAGYEDGSTPVGGSRPSARVISNKIFSQTESIPNQKGASNIFWLWGQFIDHTITLVPDGEESFDIPVPSGDPFFDPGETGTKKIGLHRSKFDPKTGTDSSNPRQHPNLLTPFIDGSNLYGSTQNRNNYIRLWKDGLLKTSHGNMLPIKSDQITDNAMPSRSVFVAGDVRADEHIGLNAIHCLWVREHNFWATKIKEYYSDLPDEQIYQRAKVMVEAEMEHIHYHEFLPLLLGESLEKYNGYQDVNPQMSVEFSTAAYRLGHSLISSNLYSKYNIELKDTFFQPHMMSNNNFSFNLDTILGHLSDTKAQELDAKVIDDLRNFLFGKPGQGGLDLVSLNIQRGREHGLKDYEFIREQLGTPVGLSEESVNRLKETYNSLNDVDLWVGALLETPQDKSMLGPLFHKIVKEQFEKIRNADKFWYESRLPHKLLHIVKHTKLSDVVRRNTNLKCIRDHLMVL